MLDNILWGLLSGAIAVFVLASALFFMYKIQKLSGITKLYRAALYVGCVALIIAQYALVFYLVLQADFGSLEKSVSFAGSFLASLLLTGAISAFFYQKFLD